MKTILPDTICGMDEQKKLPLPEKELPEPHDMLLRAPPLAERYPYFKLLVAAVILAIVGVVLFWFVMLQGYQAGPIPAPSPIPSPTQPSPTPTPRIEGTTYVNSANKFSIEFPLGWKVKEYNDSGRLLVEFVPPNLDLIDEQKYITPLFYIELNEKPFSESPTGNRNIENDPFVVKNWKPITVNGVTGHYYDSMNCAPLCPTTFDIPFDNGRKTLATKKVEVADEVERIYKDTGIRIENATNTLFLKIINSFKFLNNNQSQTPKVCTQDAKVCPDGSSVGRTGPNCEFAACPQ